MKYELAMRTEAGVLVRLMWSREENAVEVEYFDLRTGETFTSRVPNAEAMTAFRHPNAYRLAA